MARVKIDEFQRISVRKKLNSNSQIRGIRPPFTIHTRAGVRLVVSSSSNQLLQRVLLVLLCFLQFAQGSSTRCSKIPRVAAEHTIQAREWKLSCHQVDRPAPEIYHSCRTGELGSCWSCLDLESSNPSRQPFFLQSTSSYGRSQASLARDVVSSKFSLREFRGELSHQFRMMKLGPTDVNGEEDVRTKVGPEDKEAQHWRLVDIATVCIGDPTTSSRRFSTVNLDYKGLQLEATSWSWRCNSTLSGDFGARMTKSDAAAAGASQTTDSTESESTLSPHLDTITLKVHKSTKSESTFSSDSTLTIQKKTKSESTISPDFSTKMLSFHKTMQIRRWTDSVLFQILEAVDDELHADHESSSCDNHGRPTATVTTARRMLISDSWKPVIVVDSVVVGIGFFLAVSALSCWVWQWRAITKWDGDRHTPSFTPSSSISPAVDRSQSPRRRPVSDREAPTRPSPSVTGSGRGRRPGSADDGEGRLSGRWAQVKDGPGRWEELPEEEVPLRGGPRPEEDDPDRDFRAVPDVGPGPGLEGPEEGLWRAPRPAHEGHGSWPHGPEEGPARGPHAAREGPGRGSHVVGEGSVRGRWAAEGEDADGRTRVTDKAMEGGFPEEEDERAGATVHSSSPARYRAEPFCFPGLVAATGGFHEENKLGAGSFGSVYRGLLFDGREVAIKRADRNNVEKLVNKQKSFRAELDVMSRLHHKHLVNLVGYCDDCDEMMLVYEYMPNGTLSDHLHNKRFQSRALFSWKVRIRVALQAARGIEYLHTYAEPPVIHRDIKSSNILLDAKGSVRVSDFGLCLIFPSSSTDEGEEEEGRQHVTTNAAGTIGYMDPEYYCHRHLTTKSDVYSFGVVILELLTGKWAIHRRDNSNVTVVEYAVPAIEANDVASILDPRVQVVSRNEFAAIKVMAEVGRQAVQRRGKERPSMTEIIRRLEHAVTLCRSRHAPIPVFGADIGSSTDPSLSPLSRSRPSSGPSTDRLGPPVFHSDPGPAAGCAAPPSHESIKGVVEEEEGPSSGTDVAQFGSLIRSCSQVHPILEEFVQDIPRGHIHPKGSYDDEHFDDRYYPSDDVVDIQFYNDSPWPPCSHEELLRPTQSSGSDASVSTIAMVSSASATSCQGGGGPSSRAHCSSRWERTPEHRESVLRKLRESWQRAAKKRSMIKSGENFSRSDCLSGDGALPRGGGSFFSCEGGGSAAASLLATEVPLDLYSAVVLDDPLLDRRTPVMAGFSNFSELGPPEDVNPPRLRTPPQQLPPEQREIGSHGRRRVGHHGEEPSHGLAVAERQVCQGSLECWEEPSDDYSSVGDDVVDIHEFVDEYPDGQAGSTSYAGFSNFSVLQDLDELMKILHTLKKQHEQEKEQEMLQEFHEEQHPGLR